MTGTQEKSPGRVLTGVHFMLGNYAVAEGAIAAGCNFFAGYPITPANEISERMSKRLPEVGGIFVKEDGLAPLCIGGKLWQGPSHDGHCQCRLQLYAGSSCCYTIEAPVVVVDVQRCRGENFASQAGVMQIGGAPAVTTSYRATPSSVQESFDYVIRAFNLAEKYRNPVIVMSETTIALMRERIVIPPADQIPVLHRKRTTEVPSSDFLPYKAEESGAPDFAPLGSGYRTIYSLNPHDERGRIDWDPVVFEKLYKRITGKIRDNRKDICVTESFYMDDAEIGLIAYGSEVRPAIDAAEMARDKGVVASGWPPFGRCRSRSVVATR